MSLLLLSSGATASGVTGAAAGTLGAATGTAAGAEALTAAAAGTAAAVTGTAAGTPEHMGAEVYLNSRLSTLVRM